MAVELTANAVQAVSAGQNVLFTDAPVKCGRGYVVHREGAGLVTLRGICNGCSPIARYRVLFVGNISVPTGGTAGAISVAVKRFPPLRRRQHPPPWEMHSTWRLPRLWMFPVGAA